MSNEHDARRDQFAAAALAGLLANPQTHETFEAYADIADEAWRYADAMLGGLRGDEEAS